MSLRLLATLALATGLATAKPIRSSQSGPTYSKRFPQSSDLALTSVINGNRGEGFNLVEDFNSLNQRQQVIQIQQQSLKISNDDDDERKQKIVQQVEQVLIVDQVNNGISNNLNNVFRKSNFHAQFQEISTVVLVITQIQISIDNGAQQQDIFAQSALVANRGARETQTVMVFDSRTLVAGDILRDNAFEKIGRVGGIAGATKALDVGAAALPTKTAGVQLFGAKPTWTAVAQDPAELLGSIWKGALEDLKDVERDGEDLKLNDLIAGLERERLDEEGKFLDAEKDDAEKDNDDEGHKKKAEEEKKAEEQKKADEEELKKQEEQNSKDEERKKQDEKEKKDDEQKKKDEEQKQKDEEQKKKDEEQKKKDEEEHRKQDDEQKKRDEEQKQKDEEQKQKDEEERKKMKS